jgi:hypothetical protein
MGGEFFTFNAVASFPVIQRLDGVSFTTVLTLDDAGAVNQGTGNVSGMWPDGNDLIVAFVKDNSTPVHVYRCSNVNSYSVDAASDTNINSVLSSIGNTSQGGLYPFLSAHPDPTAAEQQLYFWYKDGQLNSGTFTLFRFNYRRIAHGAETAAPFVVGETITQTTSGAEGLVTSVNAGSLDLTNVTGTFNDTDTLTGSVSSNTAPATGLLVEQACTNLGAGPSGVNFGLPCAVNGGLERIPAIGQGRPVFSGILGEQPGGSRRRTFNMFGTGLDQDLALYYSSGSEAPDTRGTIIAVAITDTAVTSGLVGNLGEVAIEALTPTAGDAYVVSAIDGDGSLTPGGISIDSGDIVEYDGAAWTFVHGSTSKPFFTSALEAYWKFNDNFLDASGNGHNMGVSGSVPFAAGLIANGADFPGTAGNFLGIASAPFAISVWIDPDTVSTLMTIVGQSNATFSGWILQVLATGAVRFRQAASTLDSSASDITAAGGLHHVVVTSNGLTTRIYVNGSEVASATTVATVSSGFTFLIGTDSAGANLFDGVIDELALYTRHLGSDEVALLYGAGSGLGSELDRFGFPDKSTHATLNSTTALVSPYTDGVDEGKLAAFDGTSFTGILTTIPAIVSNEIQGVTPNNGATTYYVDHDSITDGLSSGDRLSVSLDIV